jgi:hypothetical protein
MTSLEHLGYRQEFQRALTFRDLVVYGMVFMVPISPFGVFVDRRRVRVLCRAHHYPEKTRRHRFVTSRSTT